MFCHTCGRRAVRGETFSIRRAPTYCTGCDMTPGRCRCKPRPDDTEDDPMAYGSMPTRQAPRFCARCGTPLRFLPDDDDRFDIYTGEPIEGGSGTFQCPKYEDSYRGDNGHTRIKGTKGRGPVEFRG